MKTLTSLAFLAAVIVGAQANADCCAPKPVVCEAPCPVITTCQPMERVPGPCCTTMCCPKVVGFLGI